MANWATYISILPFNYELSIAIQVDYLEEFTPSYVYDAIP